MGETNDRIQDALAAYLDYLEIGGPKPDTSHLTDSERDELNDLIGALEMTEGVAFGLGRREESAFVEASSTSPAARPVADVEGQGPSELLLASLRDAMPADVRIDSEPARFSHVGAVEVIDAWIVGTFGGRVRVWLLAVDAAQELETNSDCLTDLTRVFGVFPDTTAVALVAKDLSCLIVKPEDCAPQIQIPSGSLVGRRYKQPIRPVGEALFAFLNELIPYWDPVPAFDPDAGLTIDVPAVGEELARSAIERQCAIGERARRGNPKKDALLALGRKEIAALTKLAHGLFDGSVHPDEIESRIERLAKNR